MLANFAQSIVEDPNEMKISSRKSLTSSKEVYSSKDKENVVPPSKYETGMAFPPITEESGEYCGSYLSGGNKSSYKQKQVSDSMHPEQDTHGGPAQKFYSNLKLHKDGQTIAKEILSGVGCIDSNNASMSLEQLEDIVNDNVIAIKQAGKWATLEKYITVEDMATKVKKSILKKVRVVTPETL